jgi:hypothetical protein
MTEALTPTEKGHLVHFRSLDRRFLTIALAICVTALAGTAEARTFRMFGIWTQNIGPNFQQPAIGGIPVAFDGVPVNVQGSGVATVTIPVNGFTDPIATFIIPIQNTTLVQISTMFSFFGPSQPGVMSSGPKSSRPANFAFCPGAAANPACTTPQIGGAQGTRHGIVAYTAGPNQFGGTMRMLSGGVGEVTRVLGTSPTRLQHNPVGNPVGIPVGAGYNLFFSTAFQGGPITTGGVCANGPCALATGGVVIQPGVITGMGATSTPEQTVFPFTTGMVTVLATDNSPTGTGLFTSTGSDNRTALGAGNLTLIAGGLLQQDTQSGQDTGNEFAIVRMEFRPQNLPSFSPGSLAALGALLMVGAGYAFRKRR